MPKTRSKKNSSVVASTRSTATKKVKGHNESHEHLSKCSVVLDRDEVAQPVTPKLQSSNVLKLIPTPVDNKKDSRKQNEAGSSGPSGRIKKSTRENKENNSSTKVEIAKNSKALAKVVEPVNEPDLKKTDKKKKTTAIKKVQAAEPKADEKKVDLKGAKKKDHEVSTKMTKAADFKEEEEKTVTKAVASKKQAKPSIEEPSKPMTRSTRGKKKPEETSTKEETIEKGAVAEGKRGKAVKATKLPVSESPVPADAKPATRKTGKAKASPIIPSEQASNNKETASKATLDDQDNSFQLEKIQEDSHATKSRPRGKPKAVIKDVGKQVAIAKGKTPSLKSVETSKTKTVDPEDNSEKNPSSDELVKGKPQSSSDPQGSPVELVKIPGKSLASKPTIRGREKQAVKDVSKNSKPLPVNSPPPQRVTRRGYKKAAEVPAAIPLPAKKLKKAAEVPAAIPLPAKKTKKAAEVTAAIPLPAKKTTQAAGLEKQPELEKIESPLEKELEDIELIRDSPSRNYQPKVSTKPHIAIPITTGAVKKIASEKLTEKNAAETAGMFKKPLPIAKPLSSFAAIEMSEDDGEDPYSFDTSLSELSTKKGKKQKNKNKKATASKPKPGETMALLMQQKVLEATEYSCNVQNNLAHFKAEREKLEKQIQEPVVSISRVVLDRPSNKSTNHAPYVFDLTSSSKNVTMRKAPAIDQPFHSKVWHSPQMISPPSPTMEVPTFVSNSPPIQSEFAMRMAEAARKSIGSRNSTPFRVSGNLPTAFYMGLSKNDGTPSFSSDMVENNQRKENHNNSAKPRTSEAQSSKSSEESENNSNEPQEDSLLENSNAENMAPDSFVTMPQRKKNNVFRAPLKALAISKLVDESHTSNLSLIDEQSKDNTADASFDIDKARESAQRAVLDDCAGPSRVFREESVSRDAFGFDELIAEDRRTAVTSSNDQEISNVNIREKLMNIKRYLPSKNSKNRDKSVFLSSPLKRVHALESPTKAPTESIRKFFSASTPMVESTRMSRTAFGNASGIDGSTNSAAQDETNDDESNVALFEDNSELYNSRRQYAKRKHIPKFLKTVEVPESDSEEEGPARKVMTKKAKKPFNIEESGEFKKFVHDKSSEFAEVDDYEMIIE